MRKLTGSLIISLVMLATSCSQGIKLSPDMVEKPGKRIANGEVAGPADLALDVYAAEHVQKKNAPNGFVTIFGSARTKEGMPQYELTRAFARLWSEKYGDDYPILTGGGPGLMEAGNRGAKEAGKKSLFYATYFGNNNEPTNDYVTDGYVFASFAQREADMVDRAMAIVVGQGGFGTEWEIYESLSKMQTGKKNRVPMILLGTQADWATLIARINYLASINTISPKDVELFVIAETPEKAVAIIEESLTKKQ